MAVWPKDPKTHVLAGGDTPQGLAITAPVPCEDEGVKFWAAGGPGKVRIRIAEDEKKLLQLSEAFTLAIRFRVPAVADASTDAEKKSTPAGAGAAAASHLKTGYDSLMLGEDNKHWLALNGGDRRLCCVDGESAEVFSLDFLVPNATWTVVFLRSEGESTGVYTFDEQGLLEVGTIKMSLVGGRLRQMGWAPNDVCISEVLVWDRRASWSEMAATVVRTPLPEPDPAPAAPESKRNVRGRVVTLDGTGVAAVQVAGAKGKCVTDEDGCFELEDSMSDTSTDVPDDSGTPRSTGSTSTVLSMDFQCEGFAPTQAQAQCADGQALVQVTLRPIAAAVTFDASKEGIVVDPKTGSSVSVQPGALTHLDGTAVEGEITVSLSVIDVMDPASLASMPGDFSAIAEDGSTCYLQSLGAAWVGAVDEKGCKLAVAEGSDGVVVDLHSQAKCDPEKLEAGPEMWSFDEVSQKWILQETPMKVNGEIAPTAGTTKAVSAASVSRPRAKKKSGKKKGDYEPDGGLVEACMSPEAFKAAVSKDGEKSLSTNLTKLGYINCDLAYHHPQRAVMLKGRVVGSSSGPLPRMQLWCVGRDYQGRTPDVSDGDGKFGAMIAQFDSTVDIEVQYQRPVESIDKVEVCFENRAWRNSTAVKVLACIPGQYQQKDDVAGRPAWERKALKGEEGVSRIEWCANRRQWHQSVNSELMFIKDAGDEPGLPFAEGWRPAKLFPGDVHSVAAPKYARSAIIETTLLGPFTTGPPGEFVDVGDLEIAA